MARLYFLAYFIFTSYLVTGESPQYALRGTKNHLKPGISGQPTTILWKHNGNKVVEFDGSEQQEYKPFDNRITLDWHTAELEITNLRFEDSGDYDLEVEINHNLHTSQYRLEVMDKVVKPTVSCERDKDSSSDESKHAATLLCSAGPQKPKSLTKIEWMSKGMLHTGSKLRIILGDEHDEVEHTCSVSNPLSSETTSFTAKECYNGKTSSVPLIVCLSIFIPLLLLGIAGFIFCKLRQKACFASRFSEKQSTIGEEGRGETQPEEQGPLLQGQKQPFDRGHNKNNSSKGKGEGRVQKCISAIEEGRFGNEKNSMDEEKGLENDKDEHEEPASTLSSPSTGSLSQPDEPYITVPESSKTEEANNQERAGAPKDSSEGDSESNQLVSKGQSDPDPAIPDHSPEGQQPGQNKGGEQEKPESAPRSDSLSNQDPVYDPNIYTSDPDQDQLKEVAEKEVHNNTSQESSDAWEAKAQIQASTSKETDEKQSEQKSEEGIQPDQLVSNRQSDLGPAEVSIQQPEVKETGLKADPGQSGFDNNKDELNKTASAPSSPSSSSPSEKDQPYTTVHESLNTGETNNQDQASLPKETSGEDPGSNHSISEEHNDPDPAILHQSEDEQLDLKADPEQSGLGNKGGEQEKPGSASRSDSLSNQDPVYDPNIYTSDPDQDQLKEVAEKEVHNNSTQESSDTEEAKAQIQARISKETDEKQFKQKSEEGIQPDQLVSNRQSDQGPAEVSIQQPEVKETGLKADPGQSVEDVEEGRFGNTNSHDERKGLENDKDEHEEPASTLSSPSTGSPSQPDEPYITVPESSKTEEANNQERAGAPKDSSEGDSESNRLVSKGQSDPDPAIPDHSPEGQQPGLKPDPEQSGSKNKKGEHEESSSPPSSDSLSQKDTGGDPDIPKEHQIPGQLNEAATK